MKIIVEDIFAIDEPADICNFSTLVYADVGEDDDSGATDTFSFYICTPDYLKNSIGKNSYRLGRGLIIVSEFNMDVVEKAIRAVCEEAGKGISSWEEFSTSLSKYGISEFENYIE
jgi:hypothetical protein